ncbi:MAG: lipopolysaccharide biosynthesis protein [Parabacteroides sp.]
MLKKILGTIGTRYAIALLNLALIFVNAKVLGVEGVGLVGLIVASVNIAVIFNSVLCGNTLVYFMNRYSMRAIFLPSYVWTGIGSAGALLFMQLTGILPAGYAFDIYLLSVLNSLATANARFLLGKERIKGFNIVYIVQGGLLFFVLLFCYVVLQQRHVGSYVNALYVTNGLAFLVSLWLVGPLLRQERIEPDHMAPRLPLLLREMFGYGLWSGADNLAEVCTTRLNYFLIQRLAGLGGVGLLDAGTKVSESVWHISRSVSYIEYSRIARTPDPEEQRQITLQLFKLTGVALLLATGAILCVPEWVYTDYLFSEEFTGMRRIIIGLSGGIVALGCNSVVGHYFIGSGKIRYSAASSFVGLVTLLISGSLLIPVYGIVGSAISTSIAFCAMLFFSLSVFRRQTHTAWHEFLPNRQDWEFISKKIYRKWKGHA